MAMTNKPTSLVGIPKRVSMRHFGRLRDGRRKTAIQVSGKGSIGSRRVSKVREGQDCTRVERHRRSRTSLGVVHPSLEIPHTRASRSLHSSSTGANMFTTTLGVGYQAYTGSLSLLEP